jgi:uncharacterized OB-fold protein
MTAPATPRLTADLDELAAQFYAACAKGRLCFQRCRACQTWRHLPRHACNACGSTDWDWSPSSGRGRVFSWTVTHPAPVPGIPTPDVVAVVETEEGVRLAAGLRDVAIDAVALDMQVEVELVPVNEAAAVPFFHPLR